MPTLRYEPLDVMAMELPPGWRGYGPKDHIEHRDSPRRQQQVDGAASIDDRYQRQAGLMPFAHLLPERFQGRNERLGDPNGD